MCYFSAVDRIRFQPFDHRPSPSGDMPLEVFEEAAETFFPKAYRVALGCAAEPMIHPRFAELLQIAGRYRVPDLWFPTNLLPLTAAKAEAIVEAGVRTVAVSIDGTSRKLYETIRVGASWDLLLTRLDLLSRVRRGTRTGLRIVYTLMRSNLQDLRNLPAFAESHGARDLDVRHVVPTVHVDNAAERLDANQVAEDLAEVGEDAVRRGLKLAYYPEFWRSLNARRTVWRWRAGLLNRERLADAWRRWRNRCAEPGHTYAIRPNGAVQQCIYWEEEPLAVLPGLDRGALERRVDSIRGALRCGQPQGTCRTCVARRRAMYSPLLFGLRASPKARSESG